jgi:hypothetical protein
MLVLEWLAASALGVGLLAVLALARALPAVVLLLVVPFMESSPSRSCAILHARKSGRMRTSGKPDRVDGNPVFHRFERSLVRAEPMNAGLYRQNRVTPGTRLA